MSKSRKKNIKDRFEKKKLIATKHKKKYPKTEKKNDRYGRHINERFKRE